MKRFTVILAVALILAASLPAAAQDETRAAPPNETWANASGLTPNMSVIVPNGAEAIIEGGEPNHLCRTGGPATGFDSIWFEFAVPAGTVVIDSAGTSQFSGTPNTIMSIYRSRVEGIATINDLVSVACNDDPASGGSLARIEISLPAGAYWIQVSSYTNINQSVNTLEYRLSFSFTPSGQAPTNDSPATAKPIKLPTYQAPMNMSAATHDSSIEPIPSCATERFHSSVWYTFTLTEPRRYQIFVALNSYYADHNVSSSPLLALYRANGASLIEEDCSPTLPSNSGLILQPGTYYLAAGIDSTVGTSSVGTFSFNSGVGLSQNRGFEQAISPWKVKNGGVGDQVLCGGVGDGSPCAFQLVTNGAALKQKGSLTDLKAKKGDLVTAVLFTKMSGGGGVEVLLKVVYADGTPTAKLKASPASTSFYDSTLLTHTLTSGKLAKVIIKITSTGSSGNVLIDEVSLALYRFGGGHARDDKPVLPAPPPAQ